MGSALHFEDIDGLELADFAGRQAWLGRDVPAVVLDKVTGARLINCRAAEGTTTFLEVRGSESRSVALVGNDLRQAKVPYRFDKGAKKKELKALSNLMAGGVAPPFLSPGSSTEGPVFRR